MNSGSIPRGSGVVLCSSCKVKFTGLAQNSQVDPAVRLKISIKALELTQILGQPCEFQVCAQRAAVIVWGWGRGRGAQRPAPDLLPGRGACCMHDAYDLAGRAAAAAARTKVHEGSSFDTLWAGACRHPRTPGRMTSPADIRYNTLADGAGHRVCLRASRGPSSASAVRQAMRGPKTRRRTSPRPATMGPLAWAWRQQS